MLNLTPNRFLMMVSFSIAGVWGGTARAVKVFAVGDNLDSWFLNEKNLLWERTNPSLAWLMPSADFWPDDEVLVETDQKNFTRTNLHEFFEALEEPNMSMMVEDTKPLIAGLTPPGVEVGFIIISLICSIFYFLTFAKCNCYCYCSYMHWNWRCRLKSKHIPILTK